MAQTKAHIAATGRYEAKAYDKILLRVRKDSDVTRERIAEAAQENKKSINQYIIDLIKEDIKKTSKK